MKKWEVTKSEMVLNHAHMRVRKDAVKLSNGVEIDDYFVWECGEVAMVLPVTSDNRLVMVRQYKHGVGEVMVEFPAGLVNESEEIKKAAERELLEETGYKGREMSLLFKLHNSPTKRVGGVHVFIASEAEKVTEQKLDENEEIEVLVKTEGEVGEMIEKGEIWASDTVASYYHYRNRSNR